ncbi:hypothetical protein D3C71_954570 [compost metagenome]
MRRPRLNRRGFTQPAPTTLDACVDQVFRILGRSVILLAFSPTPDGGFVTEFAHSNLGRSHVAGAALDLLRLLRDEIAADPCRNCAACESRLAHVEAAIGVLEASEAGGATQ